jgi:Co/Zn/Cd efflux system component
MKVTEATATRKFIGSALLALATMFVFFLAMVAVPAISESTGIASGTATIAVAGMGFVVALVATRWAKSMNKKPAE